GGGERPVWRKVPGAWRDEDSARGRHSLSAHRRDGVSRRRGGEAFLPLGGVPGRSREAPRRGRLQHGDRRGRLLASPVSGGLFTFGTYPDVDDLICRWS